MYRKSPFYVVLPSWVRYFGSIRLTMSVSSPIRYWDYSEHFPFVHQKVTFLSNLA